MVRRSLAAEGVRGNTGSVALAWPRNPHCRRIVPRPLLLPAARSQDGISFTDELVEPIVAWSARLSPEQSLRVRPAIGPRKAVLLFCQEVSYCVPAAFLHRLGKRNAAVRRQRRYSAKDSRIRAVELENCAWVEPYTASLKYRCQCGDHAQFVQGMGTVPPFLFTHMRPNSIALCRK